MQIARGVQSLPAGTRPASVTIGFFDGVHRGHQTVLRRTVTVATERGLAPAAVTFDRHPREILTPEDPPWLLTTLERRAALVAELGVELLVVLEFSEELSRWTPEEFVRRVLVDGLNAGHVVVGSNFTFGHKASGNLVTLTDLGRANGFSTEAVSVLRLEGRPVSSSSIREALAGGDLAWPETALGRRYAVDGIVGSGAGRGAGLGYPTANLDLHPRLLLPADGVYAGRATVDGRTHTAAVNVGTNPTFGEEPRHVEAFLLDFEGDVRGRPMSVEFWARLRDEERFDSVEALTRQIGEDVARTRSVAG